jgi:hypothetical protein
MTLKYEETWLHPIMPNLLVGTSFGLSSSGELIEFGVFETSNQLVALIVFRCFPRELSLIVACDI